ncbi:FtsW/RodA/SpoVE family cell cycle protein [Schwartzia sp. (in: firmicutes)]|nr:putative lipid II flippase FtsW [Schwartzia sp. (in: firmicutes)]
MNGKKLWDSADDNSWKFWMNDREAILGIVVILLIIGSINIFSSSFVLSETYYDTPYFFLTKHGINVCVGIVFFVLGAYIDYHYWRSWIVWIFLAVVIMLILVLIIGTEVNGARRWLQLGVTVQPAEFAKMLAIFIEAAYISSRVAIGGKCQLFHAQMGVLAFLFLLIEREPDGATAALVIGVPMCMLLLSNMPRQTKFILLGCIAAAGVLICIIQPYRLERVLTMLDPWQNATDSGYQIVQSLQAIGSGGFWGMGLGQGISKYHYLPEAHTDFAFAIWCQENGFLGAFGVILLFGAFTYYGTRIATSAKDAYGQILAAGIICLLVGQAAANMLMVGGWFPVVGVPLPFISYGGSSLAVCMGAVGILFNIGSKNAPPKTLVTSAPPAEEESAYRRPRLKRIK